MENLLTRQEVELRTKLARSTIYRKMRETPPTFPLPLKIGDRAVRWRESEVRAFIDSRPRASGEDRTGENG